MTEIHKVAVKVVKRVGTCDAEMKVGDEWVIEMHTPAGICTSAYNALFPYFQILRSGGSFTWMKDPDKIIVGCPDPVNRTVFELTRLR